MLYINKLSKILFLFSMIGILFFSGCSNKEESKRELLIYCGITMVSPTQEIASIIEKKHNCKIKILQGGSEDLFMSMENSKSGDLYIPGSDSYIKKQNRMEHFERIETVGYNIPAIFVQKGNPKNISNDINQFTDQNIKTAFGNPQTGSTGKMAKDIFAKASISDKVYANVAYLGSDSRDINKALSEKQIDIALNWYATLFLENNKNSIDAIMLDKTLYNPETIPLCLYKLSKNKDIANAFIEFSISQDGKNIFKKYGFIE